MNHKLGKALLIALVSILGLFALFYLGGIVGQVLENYQEWMDAGGMTGQAQMARVSWNLGTCFSHTFTARGLIGMGLLLAAFGGIFIYIKLHDKFDGKIHDERGFTVTKNGLYGTASWMSEKEMKKVLEVSTPEQAEGTILGESRGKVVCMPKDTRLNPDHSVAVIYYGDFKVVIPVEEAVELPANFSGTNGDTVRQLMLSKRLGAEVDYIVKGLDQDAGVAVASRLEAMRAKRRQYYLGTDRDGNYRICEGICAEARVVSAIRAGIFADLFGLETFIPIRELSYQRLLDASTQFQPGQRILVKILRVDRTDRDHIKVSASVKQAGANPYERALQKYTVGNKYVGSVSMVDATGVFVALDGGIDCLCSYPKRGRPPRGARVTVRILGINHETNRIWGAITHVALAR